ncbi:hypothetical protein BJ138DRAFT_1106622 [Hygrophoropsis aurantiaca]|uniref:Uncharacterized protein n=1 Tax=Hygrophoropsis aurantiaca TaxID=72124 RepID=A0ACB7ZVE9_9AGAM|nr:hypothetical protein BJ138DRAFT_1106622 [Hygrophoropsis aurantiaca]
MVYIQQNTLRTNILENISVLFASTEVMISKAWGDTDLPFGEHSRASILLAPSAQVDTLPLIFVKSPLLTYIAIVDTDMVKPLTDPKSSGCCASRRTVSLNVGQGVYLIHFPDAFRYTYFYHTYTSTLPSPRNSFGAHSLQLAWATFDIPFEYPAVTALFFLPGTGTLSLARSAALACGSDLPASSSAGSASDASLAQRSDHPASSNGDSASGTIIAHRSDLPAPTSLNAANNVNLAHYNDLPVSSTTRELSVSESDDSIYVRPRVRFLGGNISVPAPASQSGITDIQPMDVDTPTIPAVDDPARSPTQQTSNSVAAEEGYGGELIVSLCQDNSVLNEDPGCSTGQSSTAGVAVDTIPGSSAKQIANQVAPPVLTDNTPTTTTPSVLTDNAPSITTTEAASTENAEHVVVCAENVETVGDVGVNGALDSSLSEPPAAHTVPNSPAAIENGDDLSQVLGWSNGASVPLSTDRKLKRLRVL